MQYLMTYHLPRFKEGGPVFHSSELPFVPRTSDKIVLGGIPYKVEEVVVRPDSQRVQISIYLEDHNA